MPCALRTRYRPGRRSLSRSSPIGRIPRVRLDATSRSYRRPASEQAQSEQSPPSAPARMSMCGPRSDGRELKMPSSLPRDGLANRFHQIRSSQIRDRPSSVRILHQRSIVGATHTQPARPFASLRTPRSGRYSPPPAPRGWDVGVVRNDAGDLVEADPLSAGAGASVSPLEPGPVAWPTSGLEEGRGAPSRERAVALDRCELGSE